MNTSQPSPVTPTICSNWADRLRSRVTAVHPSSSTFTSGRPAFTIGSTVKNMPVAQHRSFAGPAEMQHVRWLVEAPSNAVTAEVANNAEAVTLDEGLDCVPDVAQRGTRLHRLQAAHQRLCK